MEEEFKSNFIQKCLNSSQNGSKAYASAIFEVYLLCKDSVHNLLARFLSKSSCSENVRKLQVKLS